MISLLQDLLARPSVTPRDEGCQDLVASYLQAAGFQVQRLRFGDTDNLWATHGEGGPLLCFNGHTDVVPPGPLDQWVSAPFEPTIRKGYLYGRGASDMKASVAAMTIALARVAEEGHPGTIALLLTSDEEGPAHDGTHRALRVLRVRGVEIDAAIVGEPTSETRFGDAIKLGRRGSLVGSIQVTGVQGHTAYPHLARNAIHRLAPALAELAAADWGAGNQHFPPTTCQIVQIQAGAGASNVIPGVAEAKWNFRYGTDHTAESLSQAVALLFSRHGISDPITWSTGALPFVTPSGPVVDAMRGAVRGVTGIVPRDSTAGGTSDARAFAAEGIPVVEFGPLNATIHAINENVEIACLAPLVEVYAEAARRFLKDASARPRPRADSHPA